jgi:hypothetical protein
MRSEPVYVDPQPPPPAHHRGDVDNDAQWLGIAVTAGGVVFCAGLFAWLAVTNREEHQGLNAKIEGVDQRLFDYQQAHALVHGVLQGQIEGLRAQQAVQHAGHAPAPLTIYGTPAGFPSYIPPAPPVPVPLSWSLPSIPSYAPAPSYASYAPTAVMPAMSMQAPISSGPVTAPVSSGARQTFALPSHLESAIASSNARTLRAAKRASRIPTLVGA